MSPQQQILQSIRDVHKSTDEGQNVLSKLTDAYGQQVRVFREEYANIEKCIEALYRRQQELMENNGGIQQYQRQRPT